MSFPGRQRAVKIDAEQRRSRVERAVERAENGSHNPGTEETKRCTRQNRPDKYRIHRVGLIDVKRVGQVQRN